ncbi:hypothetical protein DFH27DRAFT_326495 [Peziza echinospora]|nr:hypothetical protein DFH27DRAFT_326495 [Peziza echinospora]
MSSTPDLRMTHHAAPVGLYHEVDAVTSSRPVIPPKEPIDTTSQPPEPSPLITPQIHSPNPLKAGAYTDQQQVYQDNTNGNSVYSSPSPFSDETSKNLVSPVDSVSPNPSYTQPAPYTQQQQQDQYQQQLYTQQQQQQYQPAQAGLGFATAGFGAGGEPWRGSSQTYQSQFSNETAKQWGQDGVSPTLAQQGNEPQTSMGYKPEYVAGGGYYAPGPPNVAPYQPQPQYPQGYPQGHVPQAAGGVPPAAGGVVAAGVGPDGKKRKKICGLQKAVFILVAVLISIVIIGALVGGILGGVVFKDKGNKLETTYIGSSSSEKPVTTSKTTTTTDIFSSPSSVITTVRPSPTLPAWVYPLPTGTWTISAPLSKTLIDGSCNTNQTVPSANSTAVYMCVPQESFTFEIRDVTKPNTGELSFQMSAQQPVVVSGLSGSPPTGFDTTGGATPFWGFKIVYKQTVQRNCVVDIDLNFILGRTKSIFGWYRNVYSNSVCQLTNGGTATAGTFCGCGYIFT